MQVPCAAQGRWVALGLSCLLPPPEASLFAANIQTAISCTCCCPPWLLLSSLYPWRGLDFSCSTTACQVSLSGQPTRCQVLWVS